ncbi:hypothetical protein LSAT2_000250 [Lamellibrachia satsuma]|nr:hypothetical protein LSAT2_000250 [Lamellibrachia satsuma]
MPKTKQPKGGTNVGGATTAPTDDTRLETNIDGNDYTIQDALVEKLLKVQQNAYQACLQSAVAEINRRVDRFMHETTTTLTELRISLQCTQTQVYELKVNQSKENIDDLSIKMLDFENTKSSIFTS